MYAFEYHRPETLSAAVADLANPDAEDLAGGMTLLPTMKQRLASPAALIDLKSVPDLAGVVREGGNLLIGAMTRHADVARSNVVQAAIPALAPSPAPLAIRMFATWARSAVRWRTTIHPPTPAAALALGATILTNKRRIPAQDFFKGLFETALDAGELITQVSFPIPQRAAYINSRTRPSRYALVGVFVAKTAGGVRVAVTGAGRDELHFSPERVRDGAEREFRARSARRRFRAGGRPQFGPARRRRLSGAPHRCDGEARGGGGLRRNRIEASASLFMAGLDPAMMRFAGCAGAFSTRSLSCPRKRRLFRPRSTKLWPCSAEPPMSAIARWPRSFS